MAVTDLLLDCLELCKSTRLAMDVYHQCQLSDNYGFIAKVSVTSRTFPNLNCQRINYELV